MLYEHDQDLAQGFSADAMKRMQEYGLMPHPQNYEVWYAYYAFPQSELKKSLDVLLKSKDKIVEEDCRALYDEFLSENRKRAAFEKASDQIHATLDDVSGLMTNVKTMTAGYGSTLMGASQKISAVKTPEQMQEVIKSILSDTKKMLDQNKSLEQHLEKSSVAIRELKKDLDRVRREAMTDGLTGLANRKYLDDYLNKISAEYKKSGKIYTMLLVDIDHFKSFNDNHGHQVGDQVLRLVGRTLIDGIKGKDMAARYGGEEFLIVLPETNIEHGMAVAESLRKSLAGKEILNRATGENLGRITMSIGVAQFIGSETKEDLFARADKALYMAKSAGRNQVVASPTPHQVAQTK